MVPFEFWSVVDAARCAIEVQNGIDRANLRLLVENCLPVLQIVRVKPSVKEPCRRGRILGLEDLNLAD